MPSRYKKIKENLVYDNPRFGYRLYDDDVVTPTGKEGKYMYLAGHGYVMVVALTPERKIVMIKQYRYPVDSDSLEVIGETANEGETSLATAKRGLKEETGLETEDWVDLGWYWLGIGVERLKGTLFLAKIARGQELIAEPGKEIGFYDLEEVIQMMANNEIISGDTKLAVLTAKNYLDK